MTVRVFDWPSYYAARRPEALALTSIEDGVTLTWHELEATVASLAATLQRHYGLQPGDRVALLAENDVRTFVMQFACMRAGLILVPLNWRLAIGELRALLNDAEARLLVHDAAWADVAADLATSGRISSRLAWEYDGADDFDAAADGSDRLPAPESYDAAVVTHVLYTSGTTGLPKGALSTHGTLQGQALNLAHSSRLAERGGHHLNIVPLFHAGGLNVYTNPMLYWGGHVSTVKRFDPAVTLGLLTDPAVAITHLCGVLQMYELITALPEFEAATFPSLRSALFGGWGPQTRWVHETWRQRGVFLQLSYGATELGPNVSILEDGKEQADRNSSGPVLPHTEIRLMDSNGGEVATGEVGEIWVRGRAVTPGYWRRPRAESFDGDWFKSGDCGRVDASGHLYVVERLKEVFRSGGENVYPAEVELVLAQHSAVKELAIIGVPDETWGEVGLAVVVTDSPADVSLESLRDFGQDKIARYKLPRHVRFLDELPRNVTLKIARDQLRSMYRDEFGVIATAAQVSS